MTETMIRTITEPMTETLKQAVATQNLLVAIEENANNPSPLDSTAGDKIALALEELVEATNIHIFSDELLVYDTKRAETRILKHSEITLEEMELIWEGKYLPMKGIAEYEKFKNSIFLPPEESEGLLPQCFDLDGNPCDPFGYQPPELSGSTEPKYGYFTNDIPGNCNYNHHIDLTNDTHNGLVIEKYIKKNVVGFIYSLIISLAAVNFEVDDEMDKAFISKYVRRILKEKLDLTSEEYEHCYMKEVHKAIYDTEHLLYALRYKPVAEAGLKLSPIPYGDTTYTILANIFGNTVFNPYVNEDNTTYDFLSII